MNSIKLIINSVMIKEQNIDEILNDDLLNEFLQKVNNRIQLCKYDPKREFYKRKKTEEEADILVHTVIKIFLQLMKLNILQHL